MGRATELIESEQMGSDEAAFYDRLRPLVSSYSRSKAIRRVAVVGNQPLEPSAERAARIDSANLVFRVNGFRMDADDSPPTVGTRVDVVVFNRGVRPTPWFFEEYTERAYLMIEPGRLLWENPKIPAFWPPDLGMISMPNREVVLRSEKRWAPIRARAASGPRPGL